MKMPLVPASWTENWNHVGRKGVVAKFAELGPNNRTTLLYELFRAMVRGLLDSKSLVELLTEVEAPTKVADFGSVRSKIL